MLKRMALLFAVGVCLHAQNPATAVYPGGVATDKDLPPQVNRFQTTLTADIVGSTTAIPLATTSGLITQTLITIDNEIMMVCQVTDGTHVAIGKSTCPNTDGRGLGVGGMAVSHSSLSNTKLVSGYLTAEQMNQSFAEIKAIETGATKNTILPNTAPSAGQIPVGNAGGTAYAPVTVSGDSTMTSAGVMTNTKINNKTLTLAYGCAVGDPAGSALATGVLCYVVVPLAGTITGWDIVVDAGTGTIDVWKIATGTAKPTVTNTITASALPAISTGTAIHSTTLTSWTTSVAANDILGFNYSTGTVPKFIMVNLQIAH